MPFSAFAAACRHATPFSFDSFRLAFRFRRFAMAEAAAFFRLILRRFLYERDDAMPYGGARAMAL